MDYLLLLVDILVVQSLVRRWSAMRFYPKYRLLCFNASAARIQRVVRGRLERDAQERHRASVRIQSAWRGFQCQTEYNTSYRAVVCIQSIWRGIQCKTFYASYRAATHIQSAWRGFQCYTDYIFTMSDIVIVQRTMRHWLAVRTANAIRHRRETLERNWAATEIQRLGRGHIARMSMLYTLVQIIVVQSIVRRRLAINQVSQPLAESRAAKTIHRYWQQYVSHKKLVQNRSASAIQQVWRLSSSQKKRYNAAVKIQKIWRGFVMYSNFVIMRFEDHAATTIQRYWRGFWQFSQYFVIRFEIIRIQSVIRGYQEKTWFTFQNECATIITTAARRYLARKEACGRQMVSILVASASLSLRAQNASRCIQRWARGVMFGARRKHAAFVIQRFFVMVKAEVDREIRKREKNMLVKRNQRRRKKKEADENILERAWLNTVESEDHDAQIIRQAEEAAAVELSKQHVRKGRHRHHAPLQTPRSEVSENSAVWSPNSNYDASPRTMNMPSPTKQGCQIRTYNQIASPSGLSPSSNELGDANGQVKIPHEHHETMHSKYELSPPPTDTVNLRNDSMDSQSDVSGMTLPTVFINKPAQSRFATLSRKELNDDLSLEEAWMDAEIHQVKEKRRADDQYLKRHGLSTSSPRSSSRHGSSHHDILSPSNAGNLRTDSNLSRDSLHSPHLGSKRSTQGALYSGDVIFRKQPSPRQSPNSNTGIIHRSPRHRSSPKNMLNSPSGHGRDLGYAVYKDDADNHHSGRSPRWSPRLPAEGTGDLKIGR